MAKKKTDGENKPVSSQKAAYDEIISEYGDVIVDGNQFQQEQGQIIPVSPVMDLILSGGIQEGSFVGITGNPKTSKTNLALCFAANCQREEYGSRPVYYAKIEGRLSTTHLRGIKGLVLESPHFNVIQSREGKILTAQDYLRILSTIIMSVPKAVIIIDSISCLCDERESNDGIGTETRGGGAKLFSQFCRTMNQIVPVNKTIVLGITHLISNTSGMGPQYVERAARAWSYQCDYQLRTVQRKNWEQGDKKIGYIVEWQCNNSRTGVPQMKMESYIRFGVGIDSSYEMIMLGVSAGLIKKSGTWLSMQWQGKELKAQGADKMCQLIQDEEGAALWLSEQLRTMTVVETSET